MMTQYYLQNTPYDNVGTFLLTVCRYIFKIKLDLRRHLYSLLSVSPSERHPSVFANLIAVAFRYF